MKITFVVAFTAFAVTSAAHAQSPVDSIAAKYLLQPMPKLLTIDKAFPALGTYQLQGTAEASQSISISADADNKGIVWVAGLPEGRFKAYLKKSPGTYRIVPQTAGSGRQIPEGTLFYDPQTAVLHIALGQAYNETAPEAIFALNTIAPEAEGITVKTKTATSKTKKKIIFYTADKNEAVIETEDTNAAKDSTTTSGQ